MSGGNRLNLPSFRSRGLIHLVVSANVVEDDDLLAADLGKFENDSCVVAGAARP